MGLGVLVGLGAWLSFSPQAGRACNVPVFRYALERWTAYPYLAVVFHKGEMTAGQTNRINALYDAIDEHYANLEVEVVDLGQTNRQDFAALWRKQGQVELPWVVLLAPDSDWDTPPVWAGPLDKLDVPRLVDSPARRDLVNRLMSGESAVWVLLESDRAADNQKAWNRLTNTLPRVEADLQLPPPLPDDPSLRVPLPLRVDFSLLRVKRTDPAEAMFVRTLLYGEPVLTNRALLAQPLVIPVFGRGLALGVVPLEQLKESLIQEASAFLCGPCSCQVKELNPGKDLLLAADWDRLYEADFTPPVTADAPGQVASAPKPPKAAPSPALAQKATVAEPPASAPAASALATVDPAPEAPRAASGRLWIWLGALAGGLVVVLAGALWLRPR